MPNDSDTLGSPSPRAGKAQDNTFALKGSANYTLFFFYHDFLEALINFLTFHLLELPQSFPVARTKKFYIFQVLPLGIEREKEVENVC